MSMSRDPTGAAVRAKQTKSYFESFLWGECQARIKYCVPEIGGVSEIGVPEIGVPEIR